MPASFRSPAKPHRNEYDYVSSRFAAAVPLHHTWPFRLSIVPPSARLPRWLDTDLVARISHANVVFPSAHSEEIVASGNRAKSKLASASCPRAGQAPQKHRGLCPLPHCFRCRTASYLAHQAQHLLQARYNSSRPVNSLLCDSHRQCFCMYMYIYALLYVTGMYAWSVRCHKINTCLQ